MTSLGASFGGTAIEALFFARFGVEYLPYMFIGLGITNMIMSFGVTALLSRIPRQVLYISIPLIVAVVLVLGRIALCQRSELVVSGTVAGQGSSQYPDRTGDLGRGRCGVRYPPGKTAVPAVQRQPDHGPGDRRVCDRSAGGGHRHRKPAARLGSDTAGHCFPHPSAPFPGSGPCGKQRTQIPPPAADPWSRRCGVVTSMCAAPR